jgi:preprotein translocase subunit SecD
MIHFPRWKIILILAVCALGLVYAAPNLFGRATISEWEEALPGWLPVRQVNLGLDLQGGSHLLLRVDWEEVIEERLRSIEEGLRAELRGARIGYTDLGVANGAAGFTLRDPADTDRARDVVSALEEPVEFLFDPATNRIDLPFQEAELADLRDGILAQSIEIVRRRVDETGTKEPNIQRQGEDRILVQLPGVDDPERVKDLIGRTARLTFQLVDEEALVEDAVNGRVPPGSELLPDARKTEGGDPVTYHVIRKRVIVSGESLLDSQPTFQENRPVVSFRFDSVGARRFGEATSENRGRRLAIVLDGEVISTPVIDEPILGGNGIIRGGFTVQTAGDLALLLRAGALPAPLVVLEERSVGPGLGADSIAAGEIAAIVGLILVVTFMVLAYGLFGVMANIALLFNLALIIAALSLLQATLTLPGIAGIVLTVGMAVDANVLIFERIREEVRNGRSPISAIDAGYSRALTTIVDSQVTTLIAAILLYALGTGPVRGFAVTLSIGILSSMFTAVMVTRLIVVTWLRRTRPRALPI